MSIFPEWRRPTRIFQPGRDPYFSFVSLLLHMDGSAGSTSFVDASNNALTVSAVGSASIITSDKQYGTGALSTLTAGSYLRIESNAVFNMGTNPWTIEFYSYCSHQTNIYASIIANAGSWGTDSTSIRWDSSIRNKFSVDANAGSVLSLNTTSTFSYNSWRHIAVVRNGTSLQIYVNGVLDAATTISSSYVFNWSAGGSFYIGYSWDGAMGNFNDILDEFRITKGIARYTANFTPPTAPFPDF